MNSRIFLSPPHMNGTEINYINEAFQTNWIAPFGPNLVGFEKEMCEYIGAKNSVALSSGTGAMHMALKYLGVGSGDTVFCSDFTFSGSCNPVAYLGAKLVFIDSNRETLNMDPNALKAAFEKYKALGIVPKAVIVVDLYGNSADYDKILPLCEEYGVPVIEDAAEALGSEYNGKKCGTFGKIGILSFNGNKIITTSGGGMAISDDEEAIKKIHFWSNQSKENVNYYLHNELGYNYRMSNICAGIGRGQLKTLDERLAVRKRNYDFYKTAFADLPVTMAPATPGCKSNYWLSVLTIDAGCPVTPDDIISTLESDNIESRRAWNPMHNQPIFNGSDFITCENGESVGDNIFRRGVCMPSGTSMTEADLERVSKVFHSAF
ncbi:MAG: DegT/DnrJ/EryC1/StrS family aminotransferase [Clostridia bacterium]|nr:DegT/DnrJ/EryC1/StrS family aminotransferase [Clostridia bacterium]